VTPEGGHLITQKNFSNGFPYLEIKNSSATARIALQGAHMFHYCRHGREPLLWLSGKSHFETGRAIRGGIPVCWPWFGPHPHNPSLPQHGFARTAMWQILETCNESDPTVSMVTLRLESSEKSMTVWPHDFELRLGFKIGDSLEMQLVTRNHGDREMEISTALHSYLMIHDIDCVTVEGLDGTLCFDKVTGDEHTWTGDLNINGEVDRVFQHVKYPLYVREDNSTIRIDASGSSSAVVWNPWSMKDRLDQDSDACDRCR